MCAIRTTTGYVVARSMRSVLYGGVCIALPTVTCTVPGHASTQRSVYVDNVYGSTGQTGES